jgi:hypothetical protein
MDLLITWLLESSEPWTHYRTQVDLLELPENDSQVQATRNEMLADPAIRSMVSEAAAWPGHALKRHNDASHPMYRLSTLADFGLRASDPEIKRILESVLQHQSAAGAFQSLLNIAPAFGGTGEDIWAWVLCDSPTLLYTLLSMGDPEDQRLLQAADHLAGLVEGNGWRCTSAPELGKFRGPGRKLDPCPIANVYALKALSMLPRQLNSPASRTGAEMLLGHWEHRKENKYYLFGVGSDFHKLKYPFIWYDILHVADVLSRFPFTHADPRFIELVNTITTLADDHRRYQAGSAYLAWKGWSFANKKNPSPWLTFLVLRILKRSGLRYTL